MKTTFLILFSFFTLLTAQGWAQESQYIEAPGKAFYKMPSGELVYRELILQVPDRGNGDVVLKSATEEARTSIFFTRHKNGRVIFYVLFKNPPHAPEGTALLLKGTYIRGSNQAIYWGDMFSKKIQEEKSLSLDNVEAAEVAAKKWNHLGGFWFAAAVATN